jgi:cytosine/creatinine deaminase
MAALGTQRFSGPTVPVQKGHLIRDVALAGLGPSGPGAAGYSSRTNVLIRGGVIERVGDLRLFGPVIGDADAVLEVDGRDLVALPALVEPHAHLDKALTVGAFSNGERDLAAAIEAWVAARPSMRTPDIASRAEETALRYLANGTTVIRTHTDTGDGIGTRAIEAVLSVRAKLRGVVDLQVVAACSVPVTGAAGRTNRATFLSALDMGADVVGGAPWLDPEPSQCLDFLLSIAAERELPVDLHLDETSDARTFTLPALAQRAVRLSVPVTASHCVSLGAQTLEVQRRVAMLLAAAQVSVVSLPQTNLYLQARGQHTSPTRGITAVQALLDAGVVVAGGGDNIQDPFNPMGRADPLETASLLVTAGHLSPQRALEAVTRGARMALGLPPHGLAEGQPADLVLVAGRDPVGAIGAGSPQRTVFRDGRIVSVTTVHTDYYLSRSAMCGR